MSRVPWTFVFAIALWTLVLTGCNDDGDDNGLAPSMTVEVDGVPYDFNSNIPGGFYDSADGMTYVVGESADSQMVQVKFSGTAPGSWSNSSSGASVMYVDAVGTLFVANDTQGSYTITVTSYGGVGGYIQATFTAVAEELAGGSGVRILNGSCTAWRLPDQ